MQTPGFESYSTLSSVKEGITIKGMIKTISERQTAAIRRSTKVIHSFNFMFLTQKSKRFSDSCFMVSTFRSHE